MGPQLTCGPPIGSAPSTEREQVMLPLYHTKMMMHLHFTVICQKTRMTICHLQVTFCLRLMKVIVHLLMIGAMNMTSLVVTCVCGALGRAHKRDCPMSSRCSIPTEIYSTDSRLNQSDSVWGGCCQGKAEIKQVWQEEPSG